MNFIPEQSHNSQEVPFFEDATKAEGWQGQATTKTIRILQSEITQSISRLGGLVASFQKGSFQGEVSRDGFRIHYVVSGSEGKQIPGRIDIAALPVRSDTPGRRDAALRMSLYMLRVALDGTWFLQQLSPGYSALVPFMLTGKENKTVSQLWSESTSLGRLLPPGEDEFTEGEYKEIK